jgi:chromate reductase, NAD(P)H dehydrogenase (quinone)
MREGDDAGGGEALSDSVRVLLISGSTRNGSANTAALASVLSYVGAHVIDSACHDIPVPRDAVTPDGTVSDQGFTATVADIWGAVLSHLDAAS